MRVKNDTEALATLERYLERNPTPPNAAEAAFWRGVMLSDAGDTNEAGRMFQKTLDLNPSAELNAKTRIRLGMLLQEMEKPDEALAVFAKLCESGDATLLPDEQLVWMIRQARHAENLEVLLLTGRAMMAKTREPITRELGAFATAQVLRTQQKLADAVDVLLPVLENASVSLDAAEASLAAGDMLLELKRDEEAMKGYAKGASIAASVDRSDLQAFGWKGMARVHERTENWEEAARLFMGVAVLYDEPLLSAECLARASNAFNKAGDSKAADQAREELKQRYPDSEWNRAQVRP